MQHSQLSHLLRHSRMLHVASDNEPQRPAEPQISKNVTGAEPRQYRKISNQERAESKLYKIRFALIWYSDLDHDRINNSRYCHQIG